MVFQDLGNWTNGTFDYVAPSIALAHAYLVANARHGWSAEIEGMIAGHHRITRSTADPDSLIDAFRRADWIDVTGDSEDSACRARSLRSCSQHGRVPDFIGVSSP